MYFIFLVGLNRNEFNEIFLREFSIKANVYKRLAECIRNACRFVIHLPFTLTMFG